MTDNKERALLPTNVKPSRYNLTLTPDLAAFTFDGKVAVDVNVLEADTTVVTIHSFEITFDAGDVTYTPEGAEPLVATERVFDTTNHTVAITFPSALPTGKGLFEINKFQGILNTDMAGFYRSKYVVDGVEKYMATTQFEPTDARRAFPCWDEPALKATFIVTLNVPKALTALGNMPIVAEKEDGTNKVVQFGETPIMSTYLLAFLVGEFDVVESATKDGVKMRVFTPLGKKEQGRFALDVAVKTLEYYCEYFGIAYPLPKSDMVAIADFSAGAMENWGLITYRETAILIDAENSGVATRQRVAYVVAHELAHQWFGNLVTMEWWKELWLNEGFATWVGNLAVAHLFPDWDIWTQFGSDYFSRAQDLDSLKSTHPIEVEVYTSAQINEIFDAISYCKGACVIRMVATYIGLEPFRKGLNIYLNRHKYGNAVTDDLWAALSESSGKDVKQFMDNWIKICGYPVVSVERGADNKTFKISQQRFLASPLEKDDSDPVPKWWISLGFISSVHKEPHTVLINEFTQEITLPAEVVDGAKWIHANADQTGFFRVKYDAGLAADLSAAIIALDIGAPERLGVQSDAFALAQAGHIPTSQALGLAASYANETTYTVWSDLLNNIASISAVWAGEESHDDFKQWCRKLVQRTLNEVGWDKKEGESDLTTLLRTFVLTAAGSFGEESVVEEAKKRFENPSAVPADLRYLVYKLAVRNGGVAEFDKVLEIYRTAELHEEKIRALKALGATKNPELITRFLDFSMTDEVRPQDIFFCIATLTGTPVGRDMVWEYFKSHYDAFNTTFGHGQFLMARIVSYATKGFVTTERADEIEQFFKDHPTPPAARTVTQSLETIRTNAAWLARDREDVAKFLAASK